MLREFSGFIETAPKSVAPELAPKKKSPRFQDAMGSLTTLAAVLADEAVDVHDIARFELYRHRFLQENMRFAAFFKIYQIIKLNFLKFGNILQILQLLQNFCWI